MALVVGLKFVPRETGMLSIQGDDVVIVEHPESGRQRLIRLGDIRSVTDPETGTLVAGPW